MTAESSANRALTDTQRARVETALYPQFPEGTPAPAIMAQVCEAVLRLQTPEELFQFVNYYNWDNGVDALHEVIRHSACDLGTALMTYWRGDPMSLTRYHDRSEVSEFELDVYDLLVEIEGRVAAGKYAQVIAYDPRTSDGHDWTKESEPVPVRRAIPEIMRGVSQGKQLDPLYP